MDLKLTAQNLSYKIFEFGKWVWKKKSMRIEKSMSALGKRNHRNGRGGRYLQKEFLGILQDTKDKFVFSHLEQNEMG